MRDGASASDPVLQEVCHGNMLPNDQRSSGNVMRIEFVTDLSVATHGFRLEWVLDGE